MLEDWEISLVVLLEKLSISMMKLSGFVVYWDLFVWSEIKILSGTTAFSTPLFTSPEGITWTVLIYKWFGVKKKKKKTPKALLGINGHR